MTIEQTVTIPADHRILFDFLVPKEIPAGPAMVELSFVPLPKPAVKHAQLGGWDGKISVSADFNEPMEEFREYME
jgi:hypothetical protein